MSGRIPPFLSASPPPFDEDEDGDDCGDVEDCDDFGDYHDFASVTAVSSDTSLVPEFCPLEIFDRSHSKLSEVIRPNVIDAIADSLSEEHSSVNGNDLSHTMFDKDLITASDVLVSSRLWIPDLHSSGVEHPNTQVDLSDEEIKTATSEPCPLNHCEVDTFHNALVIRRVSIASDDELNLDFQVDNQMDEVIDGVLPQPKHNSSSESRSNNLCAAEAVTYYEESTVTRPLYVSPHVAEGGSKNYAAHSAMDFALEAPVELAESASKYHAVLSSTEANATSSLVFGDSRYRLSEDDLEHKLEGCHGDFNSFAWHTKSENITEFVNTEVDGDDFSDFSFSTVSVNSDVRYPLGSSVVDGSSARDFHTLPLNELPVQGVKDFDNDEFSGFSCSPTMLSKSDIEVLKNGTSVDNFSNISTVPVNSGFKYVSNSNVANESFANDIHPHALSANELPHSVEEDFDDDEFSGFSSAPALPLKSEMEFPKKCTSVDDFSDFSTVAVNSGIKYVSNSNIADESFTIATRPHALSANGLPLSGEEDFDEHEFSGFSSAPALPSKSELEFPKNSTSVDDFSDFSTVPINSGFKHISKLNIADDSSTTETHPHALYSNELPLSGEEDFDDDEFSGFSRAPALPLNSEMEFPYNSTSADTIYPKTDIHLQWKTTDKFDNNEQTLDAVCKTLAIQDFSGEDFDDFEEFKSAGKTEPIPAKPIGVTVSSDEQWGAFGSSAVADEDSDWAEFKEPEQMQPTTTISGPAKSPSSTANELLPSTSSQELLSYALKRCFTIKPPEDSAAGSVQSLHRILNKGELHKDHDVKKLSTSEHSSVVWNGLRVMENTMALKYQWTNSHSNGLLMKAVNVDARNILVVHRNKSSAPVFASSLGLLEPKKALSDHPRVMTGATVLASSVHKNDFKDAKPDAVRHVRINGKKSNGKDILDVLQLSENGSLSHVSIKTLPSQFDTILASISSSSANLPANQTVRKTKVAAKPLSAEAAAVLANLPDLSFMRAKVLMFPVGDCTK